MTEKSIDTIAQMVGYVLMLAVWLAGLGCAALALAIVAAQVVGAVYHPGLLLLAPVTLMGAAFFAHVAVVVFGALARVRL